MGDVLWDAMELIDTSEKHYANTCPPDPVFDEKLKLIKGLMTALRAECDRPPVGKPFESPALQSEVKKVRWETIHGDIGEWVICDNGQFGWNKPVGS